MGPGHFLLRQRAEPDAFLAFRPWLLLAATFAVAMVGGRWTNLLATLALFVLSATAGEWIMLALTGTPDPVVAARSIVASLLLGLAATVVGVLFQRPFNSRWAAALAALAFSAGVLALKPPLPSAMTLFERCIRPLPPPAVAGAKRRAVLMTDLPLVWGEGTAETLLGGDAARPAAYQALASAVAITPADAIDDKTLSGADLLILAQPRALRPAELVRIDEWVRSGHAALVFADPALRWANALSPQLRRPPARSLVEPLTRHWGATPGAFRPGYHLVRDSSALFGAGRLAVRDPGVLTAQTGSCRLTARALIADCRVGKGRALIIADADLLSDAVWVGPGPMGATRLGRFADNDLFVRGAARMALRETPGVDRSEQVRWMVAAPATPVLLAAGLAIPLVLCLAAAGLGWRRRNP